MVRLKEKSAFNAVYWKHCFNSEMVRLKECGLKVMNLNLLSFNSEMVRLKEVVKGCRKRRKNCFNSEMVRLKAWEVFFCLGNLQVSIPKWFD